MGGTADNLAGDRVAAVRAALEEAAIPDKAPAMASYMKNRFVFLGVPSPDRRAAQRLALAELATASGDDLLAFAEACWREPERELQYVAADALRQHHQALDAAHLARLRGLIVDKSWWDTVDSLATHSVGPLVGRNPELAEEMDDWIGSNNIWLARTAILHQLLYKDRTDAERLFAYADLRATDTEFFIRKAIGWALRQYARTDPDAVRSFVGAREHKLSNLTRREALKHL
jgi:3-methyladenine DNA glycosylase AlkD